MYKEINSPANIDVLALPYRNILRVIVGNEKGLQLCRI